MKVREWGERQSLLLRGGEDCTGERVLAPLFRGRGQGEQISGCRTGHWKHVAQFQLPFGERASLVESKGSDTGESFERRAALDEHAGTSEPAERGDDRCRSRENQGTGTGHDEDRQRGVDGDVRRGAECRPGRFGYRGASFS